MGAVLQRRAGRGQHQAGGGVCGEVHGADGAGAERDVGEVWDGGQGGGGAGEGQRRGRAGKAEGDCGGERRGAGIGAADQDAAAEAVTLKQDGSCVVAAGVGSWRTTD